MNNKIPERLNQAIAMSGFTQRYVAEEAGLTEATICRYVKGIRTPNADAIIKLCLIFNCSADWLLGIDKE